MEDVTNPHRNRRRKALVLYNYLEGSTQPSQEASASGGHEEVSAPPGGLPTTPSAGLEAAPATPWSRPRPYFNRIPRAVITPEHALPRGVEILLRCIEHAGYSCAVVNIADDMDRVCNSVVVCQPDVVVNLVDAFEDDRTEAYLVASYLEILGANTLGATGATIAACQNRAYTQLALRHAGIGVPEFCILRKTGTFELVDSLPTPLCVHQAYDEAYKDLDPDKLLPASDGVRARVNALQADYEFPFIVENYVAGRRVTVHVISEQGGKDLETFPAVESLEENGSRVNRLATLAAEEQSKLASIAAQTFEVLELRDYAAIDFVIDAGGAIYVLGVTPLISLAPDQGLAVAASQRGGIDALVKRLLAIGVARLPAPPSPVTLPPGAPTEPVQRQDAPEGTASDASTPADTPAPLPEVLRGTELAGSEDSSTASS